MVKKHAARATYVSMPCKNTGRLVVRPSSEMPHLTDDQRKQAIGMLNSRIGPERFARHFMSTSQLFLGYRTDTEPQEWSATVLVLVHSV